jgi:hypothetical protein
VFLFSLIGIRQSNVVSKNGWSNVLGSLRNEAKANEANEAADANATDGNMVNKAYDTIMPAEADADETNEADKANKADELTSQRGLWANEASLADDVDDAEVAEANDVDKANATDADKADEANSPSKATDAN